MTQENQDAQPWLRVYSHCFINATEPILSGIAQGEHHKVILQALNRHIIYGSEKKPVKIFYSYENFTGTENAWDVTPVIFQEDGIHPDLNEFSKDPAQALKKINGRPAGALLNSAVLRGPGQPRLESWIQFSDPTVQSLYEAGELALSTALYARTEGGKLAGKVRPNHVLLFKPGKTQPRDLGSMFLNSYFLDSNDPKEGETVDKLDKILSEFTNSIKNLVGGGPGGNGGGGGDGGDGGNGGPSGPGGPGGNGGGGDGGAGGQLALANAALEQKDQELRAAKDKASTLELDLKNANEELKKSRQAESDRVWTGLKNTTIPPGMIDNEEKEKTLRALYNTDRDGFYQKILAVTKKAPNSSKEGDEFSNSENLQKLQAVNDAWDQATGAAIKIKEK